MLKPLPSVDSFVEGVRSGSRSVLARAITLVESTNPRHRPLANEVLQKLLPHSGNSIRIGITGVPGAGKSTFIDVFGSFLCNRGHRLAVLAVDPSSTRSKGSILGDKTRMEELARNERCFIRPSPSGGSLGGVARKTRESIALCEAGGYDVIVVETVGVGQSEGAVRSLVDFFLLLVVTGTGDELQGFKKGVIELADTILVTKADGENEIPARRLASEFNQILRHVEPTTPGWKTRSATCSALKGKGIEDIWTTISEFRRRTEASGVLAARRREQQVHWMEAMVLEELHSSFMSHPAVRAAHAGVMGAVEEGRLSAAAGAEELLRSYFEGRPDRRSRAQ